MDGGTLVSINSQNLKDQDPPQVLMDLMYPSLLQAPQVLALWKPESSHKLKCLQYPLYPSCRPFLP